MSESVDRTVYKDMDIDGLDIIQIWRLMDKSKKLVYNLEKCVGCSLCYVVCPEHAIELGPIPDIAQGLIEDMPAVMIDTEKCSFCLMCAQVCINDVYDVRDENGNEVDRTEYPKLPPLWKFDESKCKFDSSSEICKLCAFIRDPENVAKGRNFAKDLKKVVDACPTGAIEFNSPLRGRVILLKHQLYKCDPNGCKACVNICPTESFFIPQTADEVMKYGKIACNEDNCIYCGACENACPDKLIVVIRESYKLDIPEKAKNKPWVKRWKKQFDNLLIKRQELNKIIFKEEMNTLTPAEFSEDEYVKDVEEQISPVTPVSENEKKEIIEKNSVKLELIKEGLSLANVRYFIQKGRADKLRKFLRRLAEKKSKKT